MIDLMSPLGSITLTLHQRRALLVMLTAVARTLVAEFVNGDYPVPSSVEDDMIGWLKRNVTFEARRAWTRLPEGHADKNYSH